ncbi:hypothetical protein C8J56DRAFT_893106 [Mycena floridula]|nr:hypothetical protein C8J56DRAFT_893106 [Mycena floridula]
MPPSSRLLQPICLIQARTRFTTAIALNQGLAHDTTKLHHPWDQEQNRWLQRYQSWYIRALVSEDMMMVQVVETITFFFQRAFPAAALQPVVNNPRLTEYRRREQVEMIHFRLFCMSIQHLLLNTSATVTEIWEKGCCDAFFQWDTLHDCQFGPSANWLAYVDITGPDWSFETASTSRENVTWSRSSSADQPKILEALQELCATTCPLFSPLFQINHSVFNYFNTTMSPDQNFETAYASCENVTWSCSNSVDQPKILEVLQELCATTCPLFSPLFQLNSFISFFQHDSEMRPEAESFLDQYFTEAGYIMAVKEGNLTEYLATGSIAFYQSFPDKQPMFLTREQQERHYHHVLEALLIQLVDSVFDVCSCYVLMEKTKLGAGLDWLQNTMVLPQYLESFLGFQASCNEETSVQVLVTACNMKAVRNSAQQRYTRYTFNQDELRTIQDQAADYVDAFAQGRPSADKFIEDLEARWFLIHPLTMPFGSTTQERRDRERFVAKSLRPELEALRMFTKPLRLHAPPGAPKPEHRILPRPAKRPRPSSPLKNDESVPEPSSKRLRAPSNPRSKRQRESQFRAGVDTKNVERK